MRQHLTIIISLLLLVSFALIASAQNSGQKSEPSLSEKERALSGKYDQLDAILLRMAEMNAATNPRRATLLKRVIAESKDRLIPLRFEELVAVLQKNRFTQAIDSQTTLEKDLEELLKLLESENREKLRSNEKEKLKEVLKEIEELILQQRSLKGRTTESENLKALSQDQEKLGDKTKDLSQKMGDLQDIGPASEQKESEGEKQEGKESKEKGENAPEGEKSESDEEKSESQEKISPTQQAMRQAQQRMKKAREQLEKAEKKEAVEDQEEAIAELQKARAELERLLRQLREEELMQSLQYLDARLRKMLQLEKAIRAQTEGLAKQQAEQTENTSERQIQILASRLGVDQSKVIEDADAALVLLREDGTAQAMHESLEQTRFDMVEVEQRLSQTDVSSTTQTVEDTIIESLREMIDAVAQAKKDSQDRDKKNQNPGEQSGGPEDQSLINQLSELRMIRTMQRRVNERTARYEQLLGEGKSDLTVLEKGVDELARQQLRIRQILRDMSLGKNR